MHGLCNAAGSSEPTETKSPQAPGEKAAIKKERQQKQKEKRPWQTLFDGKQMKGWEVVKGIDYENGGPVQVKDGSLVVGEGQPATGVRWTGKFPKTNYEVELEGQRVDGSDFFCGMSFPVGDGALTLILGGWGGWVTGLSCIDGYRAIDNETCSSVEFKNKKWYHIRIRVTDKKVTGYVDDKWICGLETEHRKLTVTSGNGTLPPVRVRHLEHNRHLAKHPVSPLAG